MACSSCSRKKAKTVAKKAPVQTSNPIVHKVFVAKKK